MGTIQVSHVGWRRPGGAEALTERGSVRGMRALVQRDLAWVATAPVRVREQRVIEALPSDVFRFIADHEGWTRWFRAVDEIRVTGEPTGVGGQRQVRVRSIVVDEVFIGWEDDRLFAFTVTAMTRKLVESLAESVELEPLGDDRTLLTYTMAMEPRRGFGWLTRPAAHSIRTNLRAALAALAELAEADAR